MNCSGCGARLTGSGDVRHCMYCGAVTEKPKKAAPAPPKVIIVENKVVTPVPVPFPMSMPSGTTRKQKKAPSRKWALLAIGLAVALAAATAVIFWRFNPW